MMKISKLFILLFLACRLFCPDVSAADSKDKLWEKLKPAFEPPPALVNDYGKVKSPLIFANGEKATTPELWQKRRAEILEEWNRFLGPWPELLKKPKVEIISSTERDNFSQRKIKIEVAPNQMEAGYVLVPNGKGPFPAVIVPFYDAETSISLKPSSVDFAYQLAKRGFVTLAIGSPGGDARIPQTGVAHCQPLSFLAYVAANCHTALTLMPEVDPAKIGIVGHSYGGKWALFSSCLYDKFACAVWSDPGIVFDETRGNVNYWEPWYLGLDPALKRTPGLITKDNPRTGAYKNLVESGHDLHELHALMAPRPFLVSGGSEDPIDRWTALNHSIAVNKVLRQTNRVAMTNRPNHNPTAESNEVVFAFFEYFLK